MIGEVKERAKQYKQDPEQIIQDTDDVNNRFDNMSDGKVTTLLKLWRDRDSGTIWAVETTKNSVIRPKWDTGQKLYPLIWMPWDYVQNCYHGQAAVTGLIPNQIFVNKMFAMTMLSLMTTAYPKIVYDKTRIAKWDSRVGAAIGVMGGDVTNVARAIDPATISPQVGEFIAQAIGLTKEFLGATDAALGDTRPDNTSAIIALQKASSVPMELVKQNLFQCMEDLGNIWLDLMRVYYGTRYVEVSLSDRERSAMSAMGMQPPDGPVPQPFDFGILESVPMSLKLDVGGSAYWSEIAQMNTLDNLLMQGKIGIVDYLERVPNGYISNQQELIDKLRSQEQQAQAMQQAQMMGNSSPATTAPILNTNPPVDVMGGSGYGELQRTLNETGAEGLNLTGA